MFTQPFIQSININETHVVTKDGYCSPTLIVYNSVNIPVNTDRMCACSLSSRKVFNSPLELYCLNFHNDNGDIAFIWEYRTEDDRTKDYDKLTTKYNVNI